MSENDQTKLPDGPVDIDSIPISALFIANKPQALNSVKTFLGRRGWTTEFTPAVNEALQIMETVPFGFVFLSVNSKTPKLEHVPALLSQTFNCTVIVFAEESDSKSQAKLSALRTPHKLIGAPSGPNIQRKIRQILAAQHGLDDATEKKDKQSGRNSKQNDTVEISGGDLKDQGPIRIKGEKKEAMVNKSALAQLKDALAKGKAEEPDEEQASGMIVEESVIKRDSAVGYMPGSKDTFEDEYSSSTQSGIGASDKNFDIESGPDQNQHSVHQATIGSSARSLAKMSEANLAGQGKVLLGESKVNHDWNKIENQSAFYELIKNSAIKILNASAPSEKAVTSKVGFQKISSPESGYLVYQAIAENPGSLVAGVCVEINANGVGQKLKVDELFTVDVPSADLPKAAESEAKIFFSATLGTQALHVGLFNFEIRAEPPMSSSHNPEKLKFEIKKFSPLMAMPCNVYLWLEKNKKMIMYLPAGGVLTSERYEKLVKMGGFFYFDKNDQDKMEDYFKKISFLNWLGEKSAVSGQAA